MPQSDPSQKYTYVNAGFNNFLSRSKKANPFAITLSDGASTSSGTMINLDRQQIASTLGNLFKLGRITLDGVNGRIIMSDENDVETSWYGNLIP